MTLREIAQRILKTQNNEYNEVHLSEAVQKFRVARNNTEIIEAITGIELEIEKIKDSLDLKGFSRSGRQFEVRYNYLKRLAKELKII